MSESKPLIIEKFEEWNEDGDLYLWGGAFSVVFAWVLPFDLVAFIAVLFGLQLYNEHGKPIAGAVVGIPGGLVLLYFIMTTLV
ncbi:hypothetical protein K0C01_09340 [Salinarchaeum sp. IM2453]|uniref:hypothetical protein n=1 Tax=Salinarchaeum sp. IM2453 TaxID=2862870 RepID=UPI001C8327C7|nr:hypothetical protein [Salinarchaeum sp. IM2453]QZA87997.1 hypothetical protein K0C01_09340 [Salinarchaeum sp. IM2453]